MLNLSKTTSPQILFPSDCITLYDAEQVLDHSELNQLRILVIQLHIFFYYTSGLEKTRIKSGRFSHCGSWGSPLIPAVLAIIECDAIRLEHLLRRCRLYSFVMSFRQTVFWINRMQSKYVL